MAAKLGKNVVAITEGGDITYDQIIGFLAFYSVPDQPVSAAKATKRWEHHQLDDDLLPPLHVPKDLFRTACRSVEGKVKGAGKETEVQVDSIKEDADGISYQITRLVRDRANNVIEHPKAMRVNFEKKNNAITVDALETEHYEELKGLARKITDYFEANSKKLPGSRVRGAVREQLKRYGATNLRGNSGGLYFVEKSHKAKLDAMGQFLEEVYGTGAELNTIPMASDDSMRSMVRKHFTANTMEMVDDLMHQISHRLRNDTGKAVRSDMVSNLVNERRKLSEQRESYAALLNDELDELGDKMKLLDKGLMELVQKAKD